MKNDNNLNSIAKLVIGVAGALVLFAVLKALLPVIIIGLVGYAVYRAVKEYRNDD